MGEISGVSAQRQGQISNRETVGGIERSVNQSSHITEFWFNQHEKVKIRALTAFLETAKFALKGKNKKAQHILDDQTIAVLNIEGDSFAEADYGLVVTNSTKTLELEQMLKQSAQAFMQNGGSMSVLMDIMFAPSLMDMRRKLEDAEDTMHQRQQESSQAQLKQQEAAQKQMMELENAKLKLEDITNQRDNETRLQIAGMKLDGSIIANELNSVDGVVSEREKFDHDKEKDKATILAKMKQLDNDMKKHRDEVLLKEKQLSIQRAQKQNSNS
jgi:hypothetical protein